MSILAIVTSGVATLVVGIVIGGDRLPTRRRATALGASASRLGLQALLLVFRAVPAPSGRYLLFIFTLASGLRRPALGLYNLGVLGRLMSETFDNLDPRPFRQLIASGASPTTAPHVCVDSHGRAADRPRYLPLGSHRPRLGGRWLHRHRRTRPNPPPTAGHLRRAPRYDHDHVVWIDGGDRSHRQNLRRSFR
ncbi:MAG: hypothetical protein R2706_01920 [Acidimicrobiales bacterium]